MTTELIDLQGQHRGRLTILERVPHKGQARWRCRCDCGQEIVRTSQDIRRGLIPSCGCARGAAISSQSKGHRLSKTVEYAILRGIITRCQNPKVECFPHYGGRGIRVCERWLSGEGDLTGAECFVLDMGLRPTPKHSIDRENVDGDYSPENCRWATPEQQANNKSQTRMVEYNGELLPITIACRRAKSVVHYETAWRRIDYGWEPERAFRTPPLHTNWPGRIAYQPKQVRK